MDRRRSMLLRHAILFCFYGIFDSLLEMWSNHIRAVQDANRGVPAAAANLLQIIWSANRRSCDFQINTCKIPVSCGKIPHRPTSTSRIRLKKDFEARNFSTVQVFDM
ncbi:hypothetical protein OIU74_007809 [Salix koriyanagi]|uniref:Uncharacterized protein n=1 Tax=Salix koriyanagi TaxID=2511006 RepID=A0A9Q0U4N6_9ROSI|nr:hypothetical protein OIU74_007809 [Salix koriyanagi]